MWGALRFIGRAFLDAVGTTLLNFSALAILCVAVWLGMAAVVFGVTVAPEPVLAWLLDDGLALSNELVLPRFFLVQLVLGGFAAAGALVLLRKIATRY